MEKLFSSVEELIKKLDSRGLDVSDHNVKEVLEMENYYNIINGYKTLFIDKTYQGYDEKYKKGSHFRELVSLYSFDRELKNIFIKYILEIENNIKSVISHESKNNPMISHNMLTYGYVPLWVLVNSLTLGTISLFYSYLIEKDQNDVGRKFNLRPDELTRILFVLTIYRNACAHLRL
jgi:abortive infection bacteriophage resistance protein